MNYLKFIWQFQTFRYVVLINILLNLSPLVKNEMAREASLTSHHKICGQLTSLSSQKQNTHLSASPLLTLAGLPNQNLDPILFLRPFSLSAGVSNASLFFTLDDFFKAHLYLASLKSRAPPAS